MRKRILSTFALAAVILTSSLASAAAPAKELPPEIAGHVSVRSLRGLIRNIDRYLAAASKETENEVPAGFLSMMAMIYLPIPMDDWESDGPLNLVVLDAETTKDMPYVAFFQAPDFDALMNTLAESGWDIEEETSSGKYAKVRPISLPNGDKRLLVDLGDERIALAEKLADIDTVHENDWFPAHMSDADLRANIALKNKHNPLTSFVRDYIANNKDALVQSVDKLGLQQSFGAGVGELAEKYGPLAAAEVDNIRYVLMELRFADAIATLDIGAKFEPDSLGDTVVGGMERSGNLDLTLAGRIPHGAVSAAVSYPASRILPGAPVKMSQFFGDILGTLVPDLRERTETAIKAFYDSKPGQSVSGNFVKDGRNYTISYMASEKPADTLDSLVKVIEVLNDAWARIIVEPELGAKLDGERTEVDGAPFYHMVEQYKDIEKFEEFLDRIHETNPDVTMPFDTEVPIHLYLTIDDKGVILGAGDIQREEFMAAREHMRASEAENNLFQTSEAEKVLGHIEFNQGSVGMLDPMGLFAIYAHTAANAHDDAYGDPASNPYRVALEKLDIRMGEAKSVLGFALGADKEWIINRFLVPAIAVNEVAQAYDEYTQLRKEAARDLNVPDEIVGDQDDYEDDYDEEEGGGVEDAA